MKSRSFSELLSWQVGVHPDNLGGVDFRGKMEGLPANHKGFSAYDVTTRKWTRYVDTKRLLGGDWGQGLLKNRACDFCDDVMAEVADVSVGDAWLPEYLKDERGHSVVIVRNSDVAALLDSGVKSGKLVSRIVDADTVAKSQAGGLRHRREGLAFRLWLWEKENFWHPPKRVQADSDHLTAQRKNMYRLRIELARKSQEAFIRAKEKDNLKIFYKRLRYLLYRYKFSSITSWRAVFYLSGYRKLLLSLWKNR